MVKLEQGKEYYYEGDFYIYIEDVPSMPEFAVVREGGDGGYITVVRKDNLILKEDSWQWKRKQEYAEELKKITADAEKDLDELVEKVIEKATSALSNRMKLNVVFGKDMGNAGGWAVMVADELNKLIKEKAPEIIKKTELPF